MLTVLFDLDGTLADNSHRQHLVTGDNREWETFYQGIPGDLPNKPLIDLYLTLRSAKKYRMVLVSGRSDKYLPETKQWLSLNGIEYDGLLMRVEGDRRPDYLVKKDMLDRLIREGDNILFVVDDRNETVNMWRENGITCLQCADHAY